MRRPHNIYDCFFTVINYDIQYLFAGKYRDLSLRPRYMNFPNFDCSYGNRFLRQMYKIPEEIGGYRFHQHSKSVRSHRSPRQWNLTRVQSRRYHFFQEHFLDH